MGSPVGVIQVHHLPGERVHLLAPGAIGRLVDVEHDRQHVVGRRIREDVVFVVNYADRGVEQRDRRRRDDLAQAVDELDEAVARNEVLVQDVRLA